jgi:hypothetical protein
VSRFQELRALEAEVADLAQRLETRKLVDRAKSVLQTKYGLSEPAAFRWIQKTSMDRRMSMQAVAQAVIEEVAGESPARRARVRLGGLARSGCVPPAVRVAAQSSPR